MDTRLAATEPRQDSGDGSPPSALRWVTWAAVVALILFVAWLVVSDSALYREVLRLSTDRAHLKSTLKRAGVWGPVIFMALQALQVLIAPIPGELTGFLGGFVFGEALGFLYSTLGLTAGSLLAFGIGRWLGAPVVRRLVAAHVWDRLSFLVKAEGALLCFVIFLVPGLPKDLACYLFGLSPIPFGVFTLAMTLGRMPGTWALSAQGAKTATGQYVEVIVLTAAVAAIGLPLYYFRHEIVAWFHRTRSH